MSELRAAWTVWREKKTSAMPGNKPSVPDCPALPYTAHTYFRIFTKNIPDP
jgi:hypothetical protein